MRNQSQKKSWYLNPTAQAALFKTSLEHKLAKDSKDGLDEKPMTRDLNTLDYLQQDICYYKEAEAQESGENPFQQPGYAPRLRDPSAC